MELLTICALQHVIFVVVINKWTPLLKPCTANVKFPHLSRIPIRKFYLMNNDMYLQFFIYGVKRRKYVTLHHSQTEYMKLLK